LRTKTNTDTKGNKYSDPYPFADNITIIDLVPLNAEGTLFGVNPSYQQHVVVKYSMPNVGLRNALPANAQRQQFSKMFSASGQLILLGAANQSQIIIDICNPPQEISEFVVVQSSKKVANSANNLYQASKNLWRGNNKRIEQNSSNFQRDLHTSEYLAHSDKRVNKIISHSKLLLLKGTDYVGNSNVGVMPKLLQNIEQMGLDTVFNAEGKLSQAAILDSTIIIKGKDLQSIKLRYELSMRGKLEDWDKYKILKFNTNVSSIDINKSKRNLTPEVHFYINKGNCSPLNITI
jgi:hypothetical protein